MTTTPWGDASKLRERRLAPGRGTPREVARRNQRERLFAAMVAVTAEKGYAETSVADLVEVSGVSSRSFYQHFADKEECFLATMDEILGTTRRLAEAALEANGDGPVQPHAAVEALTRMAAGPAGGGEAVHGAGLLRRRVAAATDRSGGDRPIGAVAARRREATERDGMPEELSEAIFGGVALVLYRRLARDEANELAELGSRLREWMLAIPPPRGPCAAGPGGGEREGGGRSQGSRRSPPTCPPSGCCAASRRWSPRRATRRRRSPTWRRGRASPRTPSTSTSAAKPTRWRRRWTPAARRWWRRRCRRCGASRSGRARCGWRWRRSAASWPPSRCSPACARSRYTRWARTRSPSATGRGRRSCGCWERSPTPGEDFDLLAVEATLGAFQSLLYGRIVEGRLRDLAEVPPVVTYLALAPRLGPEEAWEVACG